MLETPLTAVHRAAGARLVEFGGWEMPLHYGSQIDEHHAVRRDAGMFDVSHMLVLDVAGAGAASFLRRALANDVSRLAAPGKALYSCMLAEDGGVLDDLVAFLLGAGRYRLIVNAATAKSDLEWLERLRPPDADLRPRRDLAMIAVQGPNARARCWQALPELREAGEPLAPFCGAETGDAFVARTGYTGEDGLELMLPAARAGEAWGRLFAAGVRPCGLGARDTLRLEAGLNLYGQDMDAAVTPFECALGWTVALGGQRDFVGRAALSARAPAACLLGLVLEGGGVLRAHQEVVCASGAGSVTSGTFSPTMQASIALARLPVASRPGDAARVTIRGKPLAARIVKPPFVRHGRILV
ncbi:MAG: glycine cleavage system aminomethyltransferase GcvT [Burkholderiales bacterium]|nr:glycine cleavage system aminomethyltransferase GcvT [Burkholderiales bacterium]